MTPVATPLTQAAKLRQAMEAANLSARQLGKLMAVKQGTPEKASRRREQISKWLNPPTDKPGERGGINDENARELIALINERVPEPFPDDYLVRPRVRRTSVDDLAERFVRVERDRVTREQYQRGIRELRAQLRNELKATRDELLEEIRKLREAS